MQKTVHNKFICCWTVRFGYTPLHLAISKRNYNTIKMLIEHGVDVNEPSYMLNF